MNETTGGTVAQQRLDYQHTVGATYAIGLVDSMDCIAVHCETLDDLLLEFSDHTYTCMQVTSREVGLNPFKARDEKVLQTFANFCQYEHDHGSVIRRYLFVASCGFFSGKPEENSLPHIISCARALRNDEYGANQAIKKFLNRLKSSAQASCLGYLPQVFAKVELSSQPSLRGARSELYATISTTLAEYQPLPACVDRILKLLEARVRAAATRDIGLQNITYLSAARGTSAVASAGLAIKRISREEISAMALDAIANQQSFPTPLQARSDDPYPAMRRKMTVNGLSEAAIVALQEAALHAEAQRRSRQVLEKPARAELYRSKLRAVASRAYASADDEALRSDAYSGPSIYRAIADQLALAVKQRGEELDSLDSDELYGTVGLMTEECKFPWGPRNAQP